MAQASHFHYSCICRSNKTNNNRKLGWTKNYISEGSNNRTEDHIIEVLTEQVSDAYLDHLRNLMISYIFGGKERLDFSLVVKKLKQFFSIDALMLEGGGVLNGSFLNEGLIDELNLVLVSIADGASSSVTIFENSASLQKQRSANFFLKSVEKLADDGLWMKYVIKRD
ncbi:dihydrofolate reductase family protein [Paenibacillus sp. FSL K6-0276]|uniref:dihydrofolate reductase family protein n=1 Tax=Paenibacillus sp. FSL K6-0276 TaxID=2921450 RepID=UPI0030ED002B